MAKRNKKKNSKWNSTTKIVFFAICLLFIGCIKEKEKPATVTGVVTYNGTPIKNAQVVLFLTYPDNTIQNDYTDDNGHYEISAKITSGSTYKVGINCEIITSSGGRRNYFQSPNYFSLSPGGHHIENFKLEEYN